MARVWLGGDRGEQLAVLWSALTQRVWARGLDRLKPEGAKRKQPARGGLSVPANEWPVGLLLLYYGCWSDELEHSGRIGPVSTQVVAYVDGFNLYHGLHALSGRRDLWLDVVGLLRDNFVKADRGENLVAVVNVRSSLRGCQKSSAHVADRDGSW